MSGDKWIPAHSGDGKFSGDGGTEMSGDKWIPAQCGDGKFSGDGGAEYPCVTRYRHRRLLTFLWLQGLKATHDSMLGESDAIMSVPHLQQLVLRGQWLDAHRYLSRFLRRPTSVEAIVLSRFFKTFSTLAPMVVNYGKDVKLAKQTICQGQIRLRSIRLDVQQPRTSIDWERVKKKAAEILHELALATPELRDLIFMPRGPMMLHTVLPIGFGFRRRFRPKKQTRQPKSALGVAKSYRARWQRIPPSSGASQETYDQRLTLIKALDRMADIVDECLKAGKPEVTTEMEVTGTTTAPVLQTISSSSSVANAVTNAGKLANHVPTTGAPLLQPVFSNLTSGCGNSGIGSMANAGAIAAPHSQTMVRSLAGSVIIPVVTSVENAGAIAAPHSQTMIGSLAGPVIIPVVTSVENAGALVAPVSRNVFVTATGKSACHALTPGAQILSTAVGCLTSPAKSSELPLMKNAESGCQESNQRKNPREGATSDEQDLHLERQRTTGAFSHAGLMPAAKIPTPVSSLPGAAAGRAPRGRRRLAAPQRYSSRLAEKETAEVVPVTAKAIQLKALRESLVTGSANLKKQVAGRNPFKRKNPIERLARAAGLSCSGRKAVALGAGGDMKIP